MSAHEGRDERLVRYLLGDLTPPEQEAVEEAFVSEGEAFRRLLAAEEDLIDAYVEGLLPADDRRRFEEHFLVSPARRERLAFAQSLARIASSPETQPVRRRRGRAWLPVAAVLAGALLAGGWVLARMRLLDRQVQQARSQRDSAQQQGRASEQRAVALEQRLARVLEELALERAGKPGAIDAWILAPGLERGGPSPVFSLSAPGDWVRLRLLLEEDPHPLYEVTVQTAEGELVARASALRSRPGARGRIVETMLPPGSLKPGSYVVTLAGTTAHGHAEGAGTYHLRVVPSR